MPDSDIHVTNAANKDINKETLGCSQGLQSNTNDEDVKPDLIRDAGRGKVRGRNGQYLPKEKVLPSGKKAKKPKGKGEKLSPRTDGTSKFRICPWYYVASAAVLYLPIRSEAKMTRVSSI